MLPAGHWADSMGKKSRCKECGQSGREGECVREIGLASFSMRSRVYVGFAFEDKSERRIVLTATDPSEGERARLIVEKAP